MTGNMSNVAVQPSSRSSFFELVGTIAGFVFLVVICLFAWAVVYGPLVNNKQPHLTSSDSSSLSGSQIASVAAADREKLVITKPKRVIMPTINLGLDIIDATIDVGTNSWPLSDSSAQYANFTSGLGNKRGTMLLYGHNTNQVMLSTARLSVGDEIVVIDENGTSWRFRYMDEKIITPEEVGFIYEDVPFRVVMFTCNGWNDQYRRLMFFEPAVV